MAQLLGTDLHGTLIKNTELVTQYAINNAFSSLGIDKEVDLDFCRIYLGRTWADHFAALLDNLSPKELNQLVLLARNYTREVSPIYIQPIDHARFVLEEIRNKGWHVVVFSTTVPEAIDRFLEYAGLLDLINDKIGVTDEAHLTVRFDVGQYKGNALRTYIESHEYNRAVMLGDTEDDVRAGLIAGAMSIYFNPNGKRNPRAYRSIRDLRELLLIV